jgi:hypothetical protein
MQMKNSKSKLRSFLAATMLLGTGAFLLPSHADAQQTTAGQSGYVVSPQSNDPVPGRAHTNIHVFVPTGPVATPPQPGFSPGSTGSGEKSPVTLGPEYQNAKPMPLPTIKDPQPTVNNPQPPQSQPQPGFSPGSTGSGEKSPVTLGPEYRNAKPMPLPTIKGKASTSVNRSKGAAVSLGTSHADLVAQSKAVADGLNTLKQLAQSDPNHFGFDSQADLNNAKAGVPFHEVFIGLSDAKSYVSATKHRRGTKIESLFRESGQYMYPIYGKNGVAEGMTIGHGRGISAQNWTANRFSSKGFTQAAVDAREKAAHATGLSYDKFFLLGTQALNEEFVGYRFHGQLYLIPLTHFQLGANQLPMGKPLTAGKVFQHLHNNALTINPGAPG